MKKLKISAALATFNEEKNIVDCIDSLKTFADEMGQRFANIVMHILELYGQLEKESKWVPLAGFDTETLALS